MMNLDQARAGGEGILGAKKKPSGKDKNIELDDSADDTSPSLFESDEQPLKLAVPKGWSVKPRAKR
jgi:hypothetical protein